MDMAVFRFEVDPETLPHNVKAARTTKATNETTEDTSAISLTEMGTNSVSDLN